MFHYKHKVEFFTKYTLPEIRLIHFIKGVLYDFVLLSESNNGKSTEKNAIRNGIQLHNFSEKYKNRNLNIMPG